jgi:phenylpyruvate tautomerase PptA (4-oxalocrotonate tautomerase family)
MPLYTAITQEGTVSGETKAKIAEEITRIHTIVMKVPKNFVRVVFLSYPKGSGFTGGEQAPYGFAQLCTSKWTYSRRKNRYAAAALGDVSGSDRRCHGSARALSAKDSILQCHGDGANHASGRTQIALNSLIRITCLILLAEWTHVLFFSKY